MAAAAAAILSANHAHSPTRFAGHSIARCQPLLAMIHHPTHTHSQSPKAASWLAHILELGQQIGSLVEAVHEGPGRAGLCSHDLPAELVLKRSAPLGLALGSWDGHIEVAAPCTHQLAVHPLERCSGSRGCEYGFLWSRTAICGSGLLVGGSPVVQEGTVAASWKLGQCRHVLPVPSCAYDAAPPSWSIWVQSVVGSKEVVSQSHKMHDHLNTRTGRCHHQARGLCTSSHGPWSVLGKVHRSCSVAHHPATSGCRPRS